MRYVLEASLIVQARESAMRIYTIPSWESKDQLPEYFDLLFITN
jgi:hypothetical protein